MLAVDFRILLWDTKQSLARDGVARLAILGMILGAGVFVRIAYINQPMQYDEARTYSRIARHSLWHVTTRYQSPNNHVFHSALMHFSVRLFGDSPLAIRLPAFLCGIVLVPCCYWLTRSLFRVEAGIVAAALVAVSSPLVEFSAEGRGYTIQALLVVLMLLVAKYVIESLNFAAAVMLVLLVAAAMWTIPTSLFAVAGLGFYACLSFDLSQPDRIRRLKITVGAAIAAVTLTVVLYAPIFIRPGNHLFDNRWVQPLTLQECLSRWPTMTAEVWHWINRDVPGWLALVIAVGFCLGMMSDWSNGKRYAAKLALSILLGVVVTLLFRHVVPSTRTWLFLVPLYLCVSAGGIAWTLAFGAKVLRKATLSPVAETVPCGANRLACAPVLFAVLAIVLVGTNVLTSPAMSDANRVEGIPAVAAELGTRSNSHPVAIAGIPAKAPLRYYLERMKSEVQVNPRNGEAGNCRRLFVVINVKPGSRSWQQVLREYGKESPGKWKVIARQTFPDVELVEVERREAGIRFQVSAQNGMKHPMTNDETISKPE